MRLIKHFYDDISGLQWSWESAQLNTDEVAFTTDVCNEKDERVQFRKTRSHSASYLFPF